MLWIPWAVSNLQLFSANSLLFDMVMKDRQDGHDEDVSKSNILAAAAATTTTPRFGVALFAIVLAFSVLGIVYLYLPKLGQQQRNLKDPMVTPPVVSNKKMDFVSEYANATNKNNKRRNMEARNATKFIAFHYMPKDWEVWSAQRIKDYENECHRLLEDYSRLLEAVEGQGTAERLLQQRWQSDLTRIAAHTREQTETLTAILREPLEYKLALPPTTTRQQQRRPNQKMSAKGAQADNFEQKNHQPIRLTPTYVPDSSYESMGQVLAHLVRDWSEQGVGIRRSLYDWCLARIQPNARRILVPGSGLGRLAFDIMNQDSRRRVHAVEISWTMAAVFGALVGRAPNTWTIFPYLNDFWTNQVTCKTRFEAVRIPDVDVEPMNLSWTVSDFVELSRVEEEENVYDTVVTCFFLDTATNVLDYIDAIDRLLVNGGRWINVGPMHWHANAKIVLTAEDLSSVFQALGWKITEWSIDSIPLEYRSITTDSDGKTTSTRYEAYRPLRFVVEKK